jgi:hypothetical protein
MMILSTFFCIYKNVSQAVIGALAETNEERAQTLIIDLVATQEHKIPASWLLCSFSSSSCWLWIRTDIF